MAPLPAITMTEINRLTTSRVLFIMSWVTTFVGFIIVTGGLYIKVRIEGKMNLIEGYDSNVLLIAMGLVGFLIIVIDLVGGYLTNNVADTSKRREVLTHLLILLVFQIVLALLLFVAGLMCFIHQIHLNNSFHEGLVGAMNAYRQNSSIKEVFDNLQMEFNCCGNEGYHDWFTTAWIATEYININNPDVRSNIEGGQYFANDVPFSCCNPKSVRPCVHHHVDDDSKHFSYDHMEGLTVYSNGCKESLMDYFSKRLQILGGLVLFAFLVQTIILLGTRVLQTSIEEAEEFGDSEATTVGYLLKTGRAFVDVESVKTSKVKEVKFSAEPHLGVDDDDEDDFLTDSTFDKDDEFENLLGPSENVITGHLYENIDIPGPVEIGPTTAGPLYENISNVPSNKPPRPSAPPEVNMIDENVGSFPTSGPVYDNISEQTASFHPPEIEQLLDSMDLPTGDASNVPPKPSTKPPRPSAPPTKSPKKDTKDSGKDKGKSSKPSTKSPTRASAKDSKKSDSPAKSTKASTKSSSTASKKTGSPSKSPGASAKSTPGTSKKTTSSPKSTTKASTKSTSAPRKSRSPSKSPRASTKSSPRASKKGRSSSKSPRASKKKSPRASKKGKSGFKRKR